MAEKKHILVTGAEGQLGSCLQEMSRQVSDFHWHFTGRTELSLTDYAGLESFFSEQPLYACINTAAYTKVDQAEHESTLAFALNADAPGFLAALCARHQIKLVHISTDYVFNGKAQTPYKETDACDPQSVYGASKRQGEENILATNQEAIIIRTSWLYSRYGHNFVKTMLRLMQEKEKLRVVDDQWGSPTHAADLAVLLGAIMKSDYAIPGGIYHFANRGVTNWFGLAFAIRDIIGSPCALEPITTAEYPTAASRPAYSVLDTAKIEKILPTVPIPSWEESLRVCLTGMGY